MRNKFVRRISLAFKVGTVLLLLCTALSLFTIYKGREKAEWRQHTHVVIQKLELLLSVMKDAETGARGYIITGEQETLQPYSNAERACQKLLQTIGQLTSDNEQQMPSIAALRQNIKTQFQILKTYVALTRAGKDITPQQIQQGKIVMDEARRVILQMKAREYALLEQRNLSWEHTWGLLPWLITLLTVIAIISTTYFCRNLQLNYFEKVKFRRKLHQQAIIIANRIKIIQEVTAQVSGGNYAVMLSDQEKDTLGILSGDINKMTSSLNYAFSMLNEWMRRKDDFINITAHELKTPLTSIKAILQYIARIKFSNDESRKIYPFVEKANHQVNRLTEILKDLLEVAKLNTGQISIKPGWFNLADAVANCMDEVQSQLRGHELIVQGEQNINLWADRFKIEQVLINLVTNAIKYSFPDTPVVMSIDTQDRFVRITVTDSGIGIPADKLPFVFERYFRVEETSQNYSGMGLGLYISKGIIEQHGGEIGAQSNLGESTTFWFTLPLKDDA